VDSGFRGEPIQIFGAHVKNVNRWLCWYFVTDDRAGGGNIVFYGGCTSFAFVLVLKSCRGKSEVGAGSVATFRPVYFGLGDADVTLQDLNKGMRALRGISGEEKTPQVAWQTLPLVICVED
jgi:hypothetical protein